MVQYKDIETGKPETRDIDTEETETKKDKADA